MSSDSTLPPYTPNPTGLPAPSEKPGAGVSQPDMDRSAAADNKTPLAPSSAKQVAISSVEEVPAMGKEGKITDNPAQARPVSAINGTMATTALSHSVSIADGVPSATAYHVFPTQEDDLIVNMSDTVTTLYYISRNDIFSTDGSMRVHAFSQAGPLLAEAKTKHGFCKEKSMITYNFPVPQGNMDPSKAEPRELTLKRDASWLTRKHKITMSDGRTYIVKGKTSESSLCYWGNLTVVDEITSTMVADFESRWLKSFSNVGTIVLYGEMDRGERWREEMLIVILGLAHKEYRKAWWLMTGIPPFH